MSATACPHCRVQLKLPEGKLHSKVKCPQCGEAFVARPQAAAGQEPTKRQRKRPTKKKANPTPWVVLLVAGALSVLAWMWIQGRAEDGGDAPVRTAGTGNRAADSAPPPERAEVAPMEHPATRVALQLLSAARFGNETQAAGLLDLPVWYERAHPDAGRWTTLSTAERGEATDRTVGGVLADPALRAAAELEFEAAFFAEPPADTASLTLRSPETPTTGHRFELALRDGRWRILSYAAVEDPPVGATEEGAGQAEGVPPGESKVFAETSDGGRILRGTVAEVELVPGTTAEEEGAIRERFRLALAESGLESKLAKRELIETGHKAVPVLMNELVARPLDGSSSRTEEVAVIHGLLQDITFRRAAFPLRDLSADSPEELLRRQKEAVAAWFGWWKLWGRRWDAWVEESGMPKPDPQRAGRTRR